MSKTLFASLILVLALAGSASTANASSFALTPSTQSAVAGDIFALEIWMDFTQTTIGGNFDISFDASVLDFVAWEFSGLGDPGFAREPDIGPGYLSGFAIGDFDVGITGINLVGTLRFAVDANATPDSTSLIFHEGRYGFVDFSTFQTIPTDYYGAEINIATAATPLPAAGWLFFGGLGLLFAATRRR